uniref:Ig-like domain-containing protein n=1 Tax=Naja naja TaxID=35670 RepID=A0A8C6VH10_NAJNA
LLNCSICNFYPEDIDATWMKDGENWDQETFHGDIIRNWDGTYCTWISIEINPMEEYRYCCYVEHEGLQESPCVKVPCIGFILLKDSHFLILWTLYPKGGSLPLSCPKYIISFF